MIKGLSIRNLFIILIIAGLSVTMVKFFGRKAGVWRTARIEVVGQDWTRGSYGDFKPPFWLSENIKVDQIERWVNGSEIARVIRVENYEREGGKADIYLTVRLRTQFNQKLNKYVYKGRAIEIGSPIELRLDRAVVQGQVIDDQVPEGGYEQKEIIITGRWLSQEPWMVDHVKVRDEMIDRGNNQVIAEVLSKWTEAANQKTRVHFPLFNQIVVTASDRVLDGVIEAKILVEEHDQRWFFAGHQEVEVGKNIWLYLPEITVDFMEIVEIKEVD